LKGAREYWDGIGEVDLVRLPEGVSKAKRESLTAERLEAIASFFALPDWERGTEGVPGTDSEMAAAVRCSVASIKKWKRHPMMVDRVTDKIYTAAVYAMPNILFGQIIAASPIFKEIGDGRYEVIPGDTKAANYVGTIAKLLRSGNITLNQSQNSFSPLQDEHEPTDEELRKQIRELAKRELKGVDLPPES